MHGNGEMELKRTEDSAICSFDLSGILQCSFAEHASLLHGGMSGTA